MNRSLQVLKYLIADWLSASAAWVVLYVFRKLILESKKYGIATLEFDEKFYYGLLLIPIFWVTFYTMVGTYNTIYRRHRLMELSQTLWITILGVIALFFVLLLDDQINSYKDYYQSLLACTCSVNCLYHLPVQILRI